MKKSVTHSTTPINTRAAWQPWLRPVARLVVGAHLALALQPLSALAQEPGASVDNPVVQAQMQRLFQWQQKLNVAQASKAQASQAAGSSSTSTAASDRTAYNLGRAQDLVRSLRRASGGSTASKAMATPSLVARATTTVDAETQALSSALDAIDADTDAALAEFHQLRQGLIQQGVSNDILLRHDQTEAELQSRANTLRSLIQAWRTGPSSTKLAAISDYFDRYPAGKKPLAIDPQKLPWSTPKPNTRAPATTKTAWFQNLYGKESVQLAQAGGSVGPIQFNIPPAPGEAPTSADLAPTPDVQLTAAIQAQAQSLGNNPVNIHNWVRNNVEWVPTWGSIQGAQDTLDKKRGNAFDIASLEIALLRAANIPARYQLGTVEIPAAQAMNWVGGVQKPEAAVVLLNQGGIAATGLSSGGSIQAIRMEHVWVQAYVNWAPGRGSQNASANQHVNPNGPLNAWVPLDASYKQYSYTPGLDLKTAVPADGAALMAAVQQGASITPDYTQNLNLSALQSQMGPYQNQVKAYIDGRGPSGGAASNVFGDKVIQARKVNFLSDAFPYSTPYVGSQAAELPDSQRWKVEFNGYELDGNGSAGKTLIHRTFNISELLQHRVGVTYEGATPVDQQSLANYRFNGAGALPAYTLQVRPLFQIDGITVQSGEVIGMAHDVEWQVNIIPAGQSNQTGNLQTYAASAGDETVWAIIGDSLSAAQLSTMSFPATASGNLHAVGMSYWHQVDVYASLISNREGARVQRMPSLGAVSSGLRVQFIWGIPRNASYTGRTIDIGHSSMGVAGMSPVAFQREQGMRTSYLEGSIFDQVFQREAGSGVSAAGLLQTAMEAGLRVFTLTSANADQYVGQIQMSTTVREEIINALLMGLEVTIPEAEQNVNGWQGTAYVAVRPETGAGAYIISGGLRGGAEGSDCELQPSSEPAKTTNFSPAVLFAAAIIAAYLIASIAPVAVAWAGANAGAMVVGGTVLLAVSESAVAAPPPRLGNLQEIIWNRLTGGRPWPTQFHWPPPYGTPPLPNGSCTPKQHADLEAAKKTACDDPLAKQRCNKDMSCDLLREKGDAIENCIAARLLVMDTCFSGGDSNHWEQIHQKINQRTTCENCRAIKISKQCKVSGL